MHRHHPAEEERKLSKQQQPILDEFFIIGLDKTKIKYDDLKNLVPQTPNNLYMLN
jgi:hypothetical protein